MSEERDDFIDLKEIVSGALKCQGYVYKLFTTAAK